MTLKEKLMADGTTAVQGNIATVCLFETVTEIGRDTNIVVSQLECGDYIVDDRRSGDTVLVPADDLGNSAHADVRAILAQSGK